MTKKEATSTVIRLAAKSLGWMDQGMGHGHYGWLPNNQPNALTQDEFHQLHVALSTLDSWGETMPPTQPNPRPKRLKKGKGKV